MVLKMNKEQIFSIVKKYTLEVLPNLREEQITLDQHLKNLGANSMDRMDIIISSMEEIGIKVPLLEFAQVANIGGLVSLLFEKITT